jgi:alkylation response protein AidB-like acyl-CoA dehydrogenase
LKSDLVKWAKPSKRQLSSSNEVGPVIRDTDTFSILLASIERFVRMTLDAARKRDNGEMVTMEASCCKLFASEMVGRVADRAVQIHGGAGYMQDYAVERFYRDVRLFRLYEGTSQIQQLVIARNMIRQARQR